MSLDVRVESIFTENLNNSLSCLCFVMWSFMYSV
jgi:hypothetical protein